MNIRDLIAPELCYMENQQFGDFPFIIVFDGADIPKNKVCQTYYVVSSEGLGDPFGQNEDSKEIKRGFDVTFNGDYYQPQGISKATYDGTQKVGYSPNNKLFYFYNEKEVKEGDEFETFEISEDEFILKKSSRKMVVKKENSYLNFELKETKSFFGI